MYVCLRAHSQVQFGRGLGPRKKKKKCRERGSAMAVNERAARALKDIIKRQGNETCADCGARGECEVFTWSNVGARAGGP